MHKYNSNKVYLPKYDFYRCYGCKYANFISIKNVIYKILDANMIFTKYMSEY